METKECQTCGKTFARGKWDVPSRWATRTICSVACRTAWNKGLDKTDKRVASYLKGGEATRFTSESSTGAKNVNWKGDTASYAAKHIWIKYHYGNPKLCETCGVTDRKMYHWANISREYKRDRADWLRLCVPCHKKLDLSNPKATIV